MDATIIIAIVPVVLLVAYIVWLVRAKVTEGRDIDLREPITALVICLVAVLIIGSMTASTVTYTYSEETNTLYINQNLIDSNQPFDSYGAEVKSVVIGNNCHKIGTGTLDSLTNLEHISIGEGVEVANGAFSQTFKDPFDADIAMADVSGYEYAGFGDGTLYQCDPGIFTYSSGTITGLASSASSAVNVVLPAAHSGTKITSIGNNAFQHKQGIVRGLTVPGSEIASIGNNAFYNCTSLESFRMPATVTSIGGAFYYCSALTEIQLPDSVSSIGSGAFGYCSALKTANIPSSLASIEGTVFASSGLESMDFPATLTSIGSNAFYNCMEITEVSFASGFSATIDANAFRSWTFYASDGTTTLDKTDPTALAGKTFQGTAAALVEVAPGSLSLSPEQIQIVHLHDVELQDLKDQISIDPLPFQPSLQTQEQEPVSA